MKRKVHAILKHAKIALSDLPDMDARKAVLISAICFMIAGQANALADQGRRDSAKTPSLQELAGNPPAPMSLEERNDLKIMRRLQRERTPEEMAETWLYVDLDFGPFSRALGFDIERKAPSLARGMKTILSKLDKTASELKLKHQRTRPYLKYPDLEPCLPTENSFSYPSRHATWYTAAAELLSTLFPEKRQQLTDIGRKASLSRVICGVHYPSDVEAGARMGQAAAGQIKKSLEWERLKLEYAAQDNKKPLQPVEGKDLPSLKR